VAEKAIVLVLNREKIGIICKTNIKKLYFYNINLASVRLSQTNMEARSDSIRHIYELWVIAIAVEKSVFVESISGKIESLL
jgi:hypothetical protein